MSTKFYKLFFSINWCNVIFFFFSTLIMQVIYTNWVLKQWTSSASLQWTILGHGIFFYALLNSICLYFAKDLCIYINTGIWIYSFLFVWPPHLLFLLWRQWGYSDYLSFWVRCGSLYFSRNWSITSKLSNLCSYSQYSLIIVLCLQGLRWYPLFHSFLILVIGFFYSSWSC